MATVFTSPLGAKADRITTDQEFAVLTRGDGTDGSEWVYGKAAGAITQGMAVSVDEDGLASALTKALADEGNIIALYQGSTALAADDYAWFLTKGGNSNSTYYVKAKNGCEINVALYTTGTAGYLDDTAASQTLVSGVKLTDTATSSGAVEEAFIFATLRSEATA